MDVDPRGADEDGDSDTSCIVDLKGKEAVFHEANGKGKGKEGEIEGETTWDTEGDKEREEEVER